MHCQQIVLYQRLRFVDAVAGPICYRVDVKSRCHEISLALHVSTRAELIAGVQRLRTSATEEQLTCIRFSRCALPLPTCTMTRGHLDYVV